MALDSRTFFRSVSSDEFRQSMNEDRLGYWWIPEDPEHRVPGVLSFDHEQRATLQLMDTFEKSLDGRIRVGMNYPLILGEDRSGDNCTLIDCWKRGYHTNGSTGKSWSVVQPQQVLIGLSTVSAANLSFSILELRSPSFSKWWRSGASQLTTTSSLKHWSVALKVSSMAPVHLCTWSGVSLDFYSHPVSSASLTGSRFADVNEDVCLRLTSQYERPLRDLLVDCSKICTFIAVMLQHQVVMPSITAYSDTNVVIVDNVPPIARPTIVVTPVAGCTTTANSEEEGDCLLPIQTALPLLRKVLRRWSTYYSELEDIRGVLLGTERLQHSCSENRLTMAVAAQEGLDRLGCKNEVRPLREWEARLDSAINPAASAEVQKWARKHLHHSNEPELRDRLRRQFEDCARIVPMTRKQRKSCIQECVTVRVRKAHSLPPLLLDRKSGIRLIQATVQIESVLLVSMLKYLGCTDDDLLAAATRDLHTWQSIRNVFRSPPE